MTIRVLKRTFRVLKNDGTLCVLLIQVYQEKDFTCTTFYDFGYRLKIDLHDFKCTQI